MKRDRATRNLPGTQRKPGGRDRGMEECAKDPRLPRKVLVDIVFLVFSNTFHKIAYEIVTEKRVKCAV